MVLYMKTSGPSGNSVSGKYGNIAAILSTPPEDGKYGNYYGRPINTAGVWQHYGHLRELPDLLSDNLYSVGTISDKDLVKHVFVSSLC